MGVNFGDELCWSCTPYSNLTVVQKAALMTRF